MALSKKIEVGGIEVTVRELTVAQVRDWLAGMDKEPRGLLDVGLCSDLAIPDLPVFASVDRATLDDLAPSDIDLIIAAVKDVNPHFFGMVARAQKNMPALATSSGS